MCKSYDVINRLRHELSLSKIELFEFLLVVSSMGDEFQWLSDHNISRALHVPLKKILSKIELKLSKIELNLSKIELY